MTVPDVRLLRAARELIVRGERRAAWPAIVVLPLPGASPLRSGRPTHADAQRLWQRWSHLLEPVGDHRPTKEQVLAAFDRAIVLASSNSQAMPETAALQVPTPSPTSPPDPRRGAAEQREELARVDLDRIYDKGNVREVTLESVTELIESIKQQGVTVPIELARRTDAKADVAGRPYILVSGFRRVLAARKAGLKDIPAVIRTLSAEQIAERRLVENLQRENLTPLEEARAFQSYLSGPPARTQVELARQLGKSQPYVANRVRLLGLPDPVRSALETGKLSPSHGEVFLQLPKEASPTEVKDLLDRQIRQGLSTADLASRVRWKAQVVRDRTARKKERVQVVEKAKFPTCPAPIKGPGVSTSVCGGRPNDLGYPVGKEFGCKNGHHWSPKTGELAKARSGDRMRAPAEQPKPTLPEVSPLVPFAASPDQLWQFFFRAPPPDGQVSLQRLQVGRRERHPAGRVEISLHCVIKRDLPAGVPDFQVGGYESRPGTVTMEGARSWNQQTDRQRGALAKQRDALEAWGRQLSGLKGASAKSLPAAKGASKKA